MKPTGAITANMKNGFLWIAMPDSITMDNYVRIEEEIVEVIAGGSCNRVVFDMAATRNLFSSGLGLLIRIKKRLDEKKCLLYLVNVSHRVRDILSSVNLDTLFPIFSTDVEFEISQEDILEKKAQDPKAGFIFMSRIENGVYRIAMSGTCGMGRDLSRLSAFSPDQKIKNYVFDLSGLDMVDTPGIHLLAQLFMRIRDMHGSVVTYGGDQSVKELMDILNLTDFVAFYKDERDALKAIGSVK
jgi:anti-anti-sigma factor